MVLIYLIATVKSIHFWNNVCHFMKTKFFSWCQLGLAWKSLVKVPCFHQMKIVQMRTDFSRNMSCLKFRFSEKAKELGAIFHLVTFIQIFIKKQKANKWQIFLSSSEYKTILGLTIQFLNEILNSRSLCVATPPRSTVPAILDPEKNCSFISVHKLFSF